jgi:alpha-L-rhamnosidase
MTVTIRTAARDWRGQMIAPACDKGQGTRASYVARRFALDAVNGDEALLISAQGLYVAYVNGQRVGHDLLTPGWTVYDDRIAFQSYPVADLLQPGENLIEIHLGDGWWRSQLMWAQAPIFNCWGDRIAAIAEIVSGGKTLLATDADWRSGLLPITKNGIYWGEDHDAQLGRTEATEGVEVLPFDTALLVAQECGTVRELAPLDPVESWTDEDGRTVHDFGQNCGAVIRFTVEGEAGAQVLIEHSEVMAPGRAWDNRNYRSARGAATYTLAGTEAETWQPVFTFMGFRYARVTITGKARITQIRSVPISSVPEQRGSFNSGHALVNRLVENTVWSQRSNFIEVPTDCPQRDERLGWTGDAQVFAGTACWLADSHAFLRKFLRDVMADQRPDGAIPHFSPDPTRLHTVPGRGDWAGSTGWGDAIVIIPWQLYLHYGDREVLEECLPAMVRWLDYLWSISDGPVIYPHAIWGQKGFTFGDWLQPVGDNRKPRPTIGDDCAATLYHFISTDLTARIAGLLGEDVIAADMARRAAEIRAAFVHEFFTPSGRLAHNDQTSYALAFLNGLVPEEHFEAAKGHFRRVVEDAGYLIGTGFIGTPALLPALSRLGMHDLAGKVFLNEEVPGWLYQVRMGATSIWERWDALAPDGSIYDPEMNSYNHYAYGAVCQWLMEGVAGLARDPERPGFAGLILDPVIIPELSPVAASHESPKGTVAADWTIEGGRVTYAVTLPEGCEGRFVTRGRTGLTLNGAAPGAADGSPLVLGAGRHVIGFDAPPSGS